MSNNGFNHIQGRARLAAARQRRVRSGQALVEMALVVTVLLFLTVGLIQYGLLANARVTLTNIAREGARYAAVHSNDGTDVPQYVVDKVAAYTTLKDVPKANIKVLYPGNGTVDTAAGTVNVGGDAAPKAQGKRVFVTVTYDMRKKMIVPVSFPGMSKFGSSTMAIAVMIIEQ